MVAYILACVKKAIATFLQYINCLEYLSALCIYQLFTPNKC